MRGGIGEADDHRQVQLAAVLLADIAVAENPAGGVQGRPGRVRIVGDPGHDIPG